MSILSHAADSSAVLGVYTKEKKTKKQEISRVITNRQLEMINTESIPLHQFLNDLLFSF